MSKNGGRTTQQLSQEETDLWNTLSKELYSPLSENIKTDTLTRNSLAANPEGDGKGLHPALQIGLFAAFVAHGAILLSLPPVIRGKGAPFLPTASKGLDIMFQELKKQPICKAVQSQSHGINKTKKKLTFFDLGSGDGRVVFRAARENLFHKSVGYEINPGTQITYFIFLFMFEIDVLSEIILSIILQHISLPTTTTTTITYVVLHGFAHFRRLFQAPKYWSTTNFHIQDLWTVDLSQADVVAVYGLNPIMKRLGAKMATELKPGSIVGEKMTLNAMYYTVLYCIVLHLFTLLIVTNQNEEIDTATYSNTVIIFCVTVSNVFTIPGWKPIKGSKDNVHFYSIPESLKGGHSNVESN